MSYAAEHVITALRAAREARQLSQRELSARTGLPQSHISKIENGTVNITLPSLVELARALELEIMLVPRKLVPAVQSIMRTGADAHLAHRATERPSRPRPAYALDEDDDA